MMRAADIPVDREGALGLCRLLLRAAEPTDARPTTKPTLLERFDRWMARARQRDRERYLSQASDVFDLEARIRALENVPYY
ncbi:MAG TPA: hypothetical protein VLI21_00575 [Casimicrobiaceae bacterium]|nr:hypothetical protein [Casimicrobiaceae bacterium]